MAVFRMPALPPKMPIPAPSIDFQSGGAGADVFFQATGLKALAQVLQDMPKYARKAAGVEMSNIAHEIIEDARDNYVPFRYGALHDSGDADEYNESMDSEITEIAMWFGGPLTGTTIAQGVKLGHAEGLHIEDPSMYAEAQHETPPEIYHHHPPPDKSGWKYLETPFNERVPDMAQRIANAVGISWAG